MDASVGRLTKPVARAKTKTQIMEKLVNIAKERVRNKKLHAAIAHTNVPAQAEQLRKMVLSHFNVMNFMLRKPKQQLQFIMERGLSSLDSTASAD